MSSETNVENDYIPSGIDLEAIEAENEALKDDSGAVAVIVVCFLLGGLIGYLWSGF